MRDWRSVDPEAGRMDRSRLDALCVSLASRGTKSLLVLRHDAAVCEWYAPDHGPERPHYTASLAKALVGGLSLMLALEEGCLSVDDLAAKHIPAWRKDPVKSRITIRHLATHSSGIEDAEISQADRAQALAEGRTLNEHHMALPGWKGAFWRREPDPFSIAIHGAPVVFEPGTEYAYSNPGMASLAYAVTRSLAKTPHQDLRSLLRARVMEPLGISAQEWSIGYEGSYKIDGMDLYANWGGASYTARATARVGQLMLHQGQWEERTLIEPAWVRGATAYAGTPLPSRRSGDPQPGSGLGWWTNFDGIWPTLPRDAFAGAGAGNQILLVVPSRSLVVVRNGSSLGDPEQGETFWSGVLDHLFTPLMDCFVDWLPEDASRAPYPVSLAIKAVRFDPPSTVIRKAFHSDNWPITWGEDDAQYTAYGDGRGFEPFIDQVLSLGLAKVVGPAENWTAMNIRSASGERTGHGPTGAKASGLLMVDGTLYMLARNTTNAQLAWSADQGCTWVWSDVRFTNSFGCPTFLNFGKNYAGARDEFVYIYSPDADSAYIPADRMVLARVPKNRLLDHQAYQFLEGLTHDDQPIWTADIARRGAVFTHPGYCRRSGITYHPRLGRYLWWQQFAETDADTRFQGGFGIYDAPEPWGPWTTTYFTVEWDTGPGETGSLPTKWMSKDGKTCYLVFSGNDCFSVRRLNLGFTES